MTDVSIARPLSPSHPSPDASTIRRRKSATRKEETIDTKQNDRPVSFFFLQSGTFRVPLNANVRTQVLADALHSDVLETLATQIITKHKQVIKSLNEIGKMEKKRIKEAEKHKAQAAAAASAATAASAASPQPVVPSVTMPILPASVTASPASSTLPTVSAPKSPPKDGITPRPPKTSPPTSRPSSSHERPISASSRLSTARKTTKKEKDGSRPGSPSVNTTGTTTAAATTTTTTTTTTTATAPATGTPTAAASMTTTAPVSASAATATSASGATTPSAAAHQRRTSNIEEKKKRTPTGTGTTPRTEKGNGSKKGKKKGVEDEEERLQREREEREAAEAAHKQSLITLESTLLQQLQMIRDLQHAAQERHDAMVDLVDMDGNPILLHRHPDVSTNTLVRAAHTYQLATIVPGTNNIVPIQCAI